MRKGKGKKRNIKWVTALWYSDDLDNTKAMCGGRDVMWSVIGGEKGGIVSQDFHPGPPSHPKDMQRTKRKKRSGWHADSFYLILDNVHHARARLVIQEKSDAMPLA